MKTPKISRKGAVGMHSNQHETDLKKKTRNYTKLNAFLVCWLRGVNMWYTNFTALDTSVYYSEQSDRVRYLY